MKPALVASLPFKSDLRWIYLFSSLIAVLMAVASAGGLLYTAAFYPSHELLRSYLPNDVVNLAVGLPILLGSMLLARRGSLLGLLCWPGALFYVLYNYLAYLFALPLNLGFLLSLVLVGLSAYTLIALVASLDMGEVQARLVGRVPERLAGGILVGLGALFLVRLLAALIGAIASQAALPETELALHSADFLTIPAWVIGGVLLWRRKALGYAIGLGLLFQASMLFIGLIVFLIIQPGLTGAPFVPADVVVIAVMGMVCFVPFGLFVRAAV